MAYVIKYDDEYLFDPYVGEDTVTDATITATINASSYFDFTITRDHRLYNTVKERSGIVSVYFDSTLLFMGEITSIEEDFYGSKTISCVDPRDQLSNVLLRPYSTVEGEQANLAPSSVDGYFQWLIDQYNDGMINAKFKLDIGVNQGAYLDKNNHIYRENDQFPSVASELEDKILDSLGGYLTLTYPNGSPTLNLYSDVHEANTQIIDFGVNLLDFSKETATSDQYTAIRPVGGTPERDSDESDAEESEPVTLEPLGDGVTSVDSDYIKKGDVVYCLSAVNRYGYKEYNWSEGDTLDPQELLEKAVAELKKNVEPKLTIEVSAVDMALFAEGYDHLECGQVARVRSKPHGIDEYLMVSSVDIDLQDPSQTKYTLGQAFDSLTGEQSSYVKSLNSGINSSLDSVAALDQTVKDQAVQIGSVEQIANDAKDTASNAQTAADNAQNTANSAQQAAQDAQNSASSALDKAEAAEGAVSEIQGMIDDINSGTEQAKQDAAQAKVDAQQAAEKADSYQQQITDVTTTVNGVVQEVEGYSAQIAGAVEDAGAALSAVTSLEADVDGFKTSVSQTYQTKQDAAEQMAQEVLDRNSAIEQSASEITQSVSETYQVKGDYLTEGQAAEVYASKAELSTTADAITATVEETYSTKEEVSAVEDKADAAQNALDSYKNTVSTTYATKSEVTQTANSIKSEVSETYTTKEEFNGLEIGGTNRILGTAYNDLSHVTVRGNYGSASIDKSDTVGSRSSLKFVTTSVGASGVRDIMHDLVSKLENEHVIVSFWVKGSVSANMMVRIGGGHTAGSASLNKAVTTSWNRLVVDMGTLRGDGTVPAYVIIAFNKAGTFWVSGMKFEYGTKPTDWTPAPEDIQTDLDDFKDDVSATYATKTSVSTVEQTVDSLTSTVSSNYTTLNNKFGSYYTKTEVDQKDSSIKSTVSEVQTTANSALTKATTVEQTADGLEVRLTQAEKDVDTAQTTANAAKKQVWHTATGTSGTTGYIGIATIKIESAYANVPLYFEFTSRSRKATPAWVRFTSVNSVDPTLNSITADGDANVYIRKTATSTWQVIVQKSEAYDQVSVTDFNNGGNYMNGKVTVTWTNTMLTSLPSGCTKATVLAGKRNSSDIDDAAKTATNYLKFDSSGLCVGDMTGDTLGYNALITAGAYKLRNGETELASFGANLVELAKNSSSAQIKMCAAKGLIQYSSNTTPLAGGLGIANVGNSFLNLGDGSAGIELTNGRYMALNGTQVFLNGSEIYKGTFTSGYEMFGAKRLYYNSSGTTGNVTLSESAANFYFLDIFFMNNDGYRDYVRVYAPNGKSAILSNAVYKNEYTTTYVRNKVVTISGTSISVVPNRNGEAQVKQNNSCYATDATSVIKIYAVWGWK